MSGSIYQKYIRNFRFKIDCDHLIHLFVGTVGTSEILNLSYHYQLYRKLVGSLHLQNTTYDSFFLSQLLLRLSFLLSHSSSSLFFSFILNPLMINMTLWMTRFLISAGWMSRMTLPDLTTCLWDHWLTSRNRYNWYLHPHKTFAISGSVWSLRKVSGHLYTANHVFLACRVPWVSPMATGVTINH